MDIEYDEEDGSFWFAGQLLHRRDPDVTLDLSVVGGASMASLKEAFAVHQRLHSESRQQWSEALLCVQGENRQLGDENAILYLQQEGPSEPISVLFAVDGRHERPLREVKAVVEGILKSMSGRLLELKSVNSGFPGLYSWELIPSIPESDDWPLHRWYALLDGLAKRIQLRDGSDFPLGLLRSMRAHGPEVLVGHLESEWLEVKALYDHRNPQDHPHQELALDVSAFANSFEGGLIVIGATESGDRILEVPGIADPDAVVESIHATLGKVIPHILGLSVEVHRIREAGVISIFVPPQPESVKPFLVSWDFKRARTLGHFVAVAERVGTAKHVYGPAQVYAWLQAGRPKG